MVRPFATLAALALMQPAPAFAAEADCALCFAADKTKAAEPALRVEIASDLQFSRLALTGSGGGSVLIDPQSGAKQAQGQMMDLGGTSMQGRARITGAPMRAVRVELPARVTMTAADGSQAELTGLATDLPAYPTLDASGTLEFAFGGELRVSGQQGGMFRGRIPIRVEYN